MRHSDIPRGDATQPRLDGQAAVVELLVHATYCAPERCCRVAAVFVESIEEFIASDLRICDCFGFRYGEHPTTAVASGNNGNTLKEQNDV
jgi:hypothetical protein